METIRELVEDAIDAMKISNDDSDVILVGGGSIILPENLIGAAKGIRPEHFGCANCSWFCNSKSQWIL